MKSIIIALVILLNLQLSAQVRSSISNLLRYGNGDRIYGESANKFQYFENLTDVRLNLPENVLIGFRFLYDAPPEVGLPFKGLARRFIEYRKDALSLRVGNSSELYGRGLVLNLFENRGLAYDTWLDGIKAGYKNKFFTTSIISGTIEFTDSINIYRTEKYNIKGGNIELKPFRSAKFGFSYINADGKIPQFDNSITTVKSELPELYLSLIENPFSLFINWANKWSHSAELNQTSYGYGIYSAISFGAESFGITLDYKNYRFDLQNPFLKYDETRTSKYLPFQNPPIVMKEHSYVLLSRSLHEVNFNDEVGFQIDATYSTENLSLNLNYSLSSSHNYYSYSDNVFVEQNRDGDYFPSFNFKYSPFREYFIEGEYYFTINTAIRIGFANREKIFYNEFTGFIGSHIIKSTVVPLQFQHSFSEYYSFLFQYEFENVNDNYNTGQENYNNHFISIINSIHKNFSYSIRYERTTNDFDISGRKDWLINEIGYRISGNDIITLSYGRERGGQICSNGICRYILPFKGFRLTIQTSF